MEDRGKSVSLTLIIPIYNEAMLIARLFAQIRKFIRQSAGISIDVIFVDDGSSDQSAEMLQGLIAQNHADNMRVIRYIPNRGKGFAVRTGVEAAGGQYILMSDADLSTPLPEWLKLKSAIDRGADIACGSRALPGAEIGKPPPFHRRVLSKIFNILVRLSGIRGIRDTQCGFKLFRREAGYRVFSALRICRFAFDVELIATARIMGFQVVEVPVCWNHTGHSTVKVFSSGARMLWDLSLLVFRRWRNKCANSTKITRETE